MALLLEHKEVCCATTSDDQTFSHLADIHRQPVSPALYLRRGNRRRSVPEVLTTQQFAELQAGLRWRLKAGQSEGVLSKRILKVLDHCWLPNEERNSWVWEPMMK